MIFLASNRVHQNLDLDTKYLSQHPCKRPVNTTIFGNRTNQPAEVRADATARCAHPYQYEETRGRTLSRVDVTSALRMRINEIARRSSLDSVRAL